MKLKNPNIHEAETILCILEDKFFEYGVSLEFDPTKQLIILKFFDGTMYEIIDRESSFPCLILPRELDTVKLAIVEKHDS